MLYTISVLFIPVFCLQFLVEWCALLERAVHGYFAGNEPIVHCPNDSKETLNLTGKPYQ